MKVRNLKPASVRWKNGKGNNAIITTVVKKHPYSANFVSTVVGFVVTQEANIRGFLLTSTPREHLQFLITAMDPSLAKDFPSVVKVITPCSRVVPRTLRRWDSIAKMVDVVVKTLLLCWVILNHHVRIKVDIDIVARTKQRYIRVCTWSKGS